MPLSGCTAVCRCTRSSRNREPVEVGFVEAFSKPAPASLWTFWIKRMKSVVSSLLLVALTATVPSSPSFAHGGGLNAQGCHNDRKNGGYHCHRSPSGSSSSVRSRPLGLVGGGGAAFRNCSEARAAGAAPVRVGSAGYGRHLDRDGDGVGCE